MDATRLRIMIVEDEAAHAEAIQRAVQAAGMDAEIQVVGTLREYRERVAARPPDIALLDLKLPDGRAVEVLTAPPEDGPFPVLIMTSYGNEQTAVEALKSGALDYMVKSPEAFAGVAQTIARVLREWNLLQERKRAEEALRESEEKYRTLFDTMVQGVVYQDERGVIISANPAAERILGLSVHQLQGLTSTDPRWRTIREDGSDVPGEEHPGMVALRTGREVHNVIMGVLHQETQDRVWISINAVPQFRPGDNRPYQNYVTFDNITERKQAEAALRARTLELEARNQELQAAISAIQALSGIVPICAWCGRRIQDDKGEWVNVETYMETRGDMKFSHGMCPDCFRTSMAEIEVSRQKIE